MKHSLWELLNFYKPDITNLFFGEHTIIINSNKPGSMAIIRGFENYKFNPEDIKYNEAEKTLSLKYC